MSFEAARQILRDAIAHHAFPAAVVEVGHARGAIWREAFGRHTYEPEAPATTEATIFDLASLTKVIATTSIVMRLADAGILTLDDPIGRWLTDWRGKDRDHITLRDLLAHCSGLSAHVNLFENSKGRLEFQRVICNLPLDYKPRTQSVYSDLGFMLLGFIVADAGGKPLAAQFDEVARPIAPEYLAFSPPKSWRGHIAPTEIETWRGRLLVGEVHDANTWALGGAAGHAGLFGSASAVGAFAQMVLRALLSRDGTLARPETVRTVVQRTDVPNSTRALGWDTMKPTSSCGTRMSVTAIGHTGFTGTSLWIDWERDLYIVLLTNRVYPSATNNTILDVRPAFHDAVSAGWAARDQHPHQSPDRDDPRA
jgi:CubicO group peptidase (beta-lactamase class C family)